MTDNTSKYAGRYPGGLRITAILNEGAPTVSARVYDARGLFATGVTYAAELYEKDVVAICNDTDVTYAAAGGIPVVEKAVNSEALVCGQIVQMLRTIRQPAASADADTLAERLAGKYYRIAVVEFWGMTKITKATVMCNGSNATVPGVGDTLKFNITSGYAGHDLVFDSAASGGTGVIPFHYVPAGTDGDLYSCLVGITGLMTAVTGA